MPSTMPTSISQPRISTYRNRFVAGRRREPKQVDMREKRQCGQVEDSFETEVTRAAEV